MNHQHTPCAQADGDPGVTRRDVAFQTLTLVATAKEADVSCLALLCLITETYEQFDTYAAPPAQSAADRITG